MSRLAGVSNMEEIVNQPVRRGGGCSPLSFGDAAAGSIGKVTLYPGRESALGLWNRKVTGVDRCSLHLCFIGVDEPASVGIHTEVHSN